MNALRSFGLVALILGVSLALWFVIVAGIWWAA